MATPTPTPIPDLSPDELSELLTAYMPDIPGYRVVRRLGEGGMSYVYLGVQESLDRQVAIKVISPTALKDEISKLRFEREARTIAKLQHPAIVSIHDVGRTELGLLYFVMPYLPRGHLGQLDLLEDEPRLLAILRALLWALDYAHGRGVVHRDIKPDNVLLDNVDRPLLADFGIAMHRTDRSRFTEGGFALGSATHMAPEQARGEKVDSRADLYSIGVLAFQKLVGELPFQAEGPLQMAVRHSVDPVPRLPAAKAHWQTFIDRALAKTPDARFASAQEMVVALDHIELERAAAAAPPVAVDPVAQAARGLGGSPVFLAAAACVVLVLAIVVALQAWGWTTASPQPSAESRAVSAALPPAASIAMDSAAERAALGVAGNSGFAVDPGDASGRASSARAAGDQAASEALPIGDPALLAAEDSEEARARLEEAALPADERALRAAARQITRRRLTQPPGDNAFDFLLQAQAVSPAHPRLATLGEAWLAAAQPYIAEALAVDAVDIDADAAIATAAPERRLYDAARDLAGQLVLLEGPGWQEIEAVAIKRLRGRLQAALQAQDLDQLRTVKAEAATWSIAAARLEPEWSQPIVTARVGDRLPGATSMVLLALPERSAAGLAAMPSPVSRADYARFAQTSGRAASACRVRSAVFNLRKRRWDSPGFEQAQTDPAVCVSLADARAYADWLGARDRHSYRLATTAEWNAQVAAGSAAGTCRANPSACAGIEHVREWSAPCSAGCTRQPVVGFGWREAEPGARSRDEAVDAEHGYDDVGFRLVRELSRTELEQR